MLACLTTFHSVNVLKMNTFAFPIIQARPWYLEKGVGELFFDCQVLEPFLLHKTALLEYHGYTKYAAWFQKIFLPWLHYYNIYIYLWPILSSTPSVMKPLARCRCIHLLHVTDGTFHHSDKDKRRLQQRRFSLCTCVKKNYLKKKNRIYLI